jgi:hypothetical protein
MRVNKQGYAAGPPIADFDDDAMELASPGLDRPSTIWTA